MKLKRITTNLAVILLLFTGCGNNSKDTIIESTTVEVENYDKPLEIIEKHAFDISGEKFVERLDFITSDKLFYYVNNNEDTRMTRLAYDSDGLKKYFTLEYSLFGGKEIKVGIREIKVGDLPPNFKENDDFLNMLSAIIKACDPTIEESLIKKILDDTDIIHNHIKYKILANALFITPAYDLENKEIPRKQETTTQETTTIQETETATQEQTTQLTTVKEVTTTEPTTTAKLKGTEQEVKTAIRNKIPKNYQTGENFLCEAYLVNEEKNMFDIDIQVEIGSSSIDDAKAIFYELLDTVSDTNYNIEMYSFTFLDGGVSTCTIMAETGSDTYTILSDGKVKDFTR